MAASDTGNNVSALLNNGNGTFVVAGSTAVGSTPLSIAAGASKTMNIEKKANKDFHDIQISSQGNGSIVSKVTMSCQDVKAVLNGNGTCKVFHGAPEDVSETFAWQLGYNCDGGNVYGPGQE